jgi:hypothetical protein
MSARSPARHQGAAYLYTVDGGHPTVSAPDGIYDDHLSLRGGFSTFVSDSQNHVYGRVTQRKRLQHFFWYYYNNGYTDVPGTDDHEGDRGGIQVHIPKASVQTGEVFDVE